MEPNLRHNPQDNVQDSRRFRREDDLYLSNANLFIANNNNPFLISPFSPPPNYVRQAVVNNLSSIIGVFIQDISSIIDLTTFTLSISTITNIPSDDTVSISTLNIDILGGSTIIKGDSLSIVESNDVTINAPVTNISGSTLNFIGSTLNVNATSNFNYINVNSLNVSSLSVNDEIINNLTVNSTLTASTINTDNITFETALGSTLTVNTLTVNSTLTASSLTASTISTDNITFETALGSTLTINTLTVNSTLTASLLTASTISTGHISFETAQGSTLKVSTLTATERISTNELIFSSLCMIPSTISTLGTPTSSILICLNGSLWKIPIEPV